MIGIECLRSAFPHTDSGFSVTVVGMSLPDKPSLWLQATKERPARSCLRRVIS